MFATEKVRKLWHEGPLSASDLAAAAGVDRSTFFRYLRGETEPSLTTAGALARALGVQLDELYVHQPDASDPSAARKQTEQAPATAPPGTGASTEAGAR